MFRGFTALIAASSGLPLVGGQAVMEGVLMRSGNASALAVRRPDGSISVERKAWRTIGPSSIRSIRFLRGFPILVETLVNGVAALNRSADLASGGDGGQMSRGQAVFTFLAALAAAMLLFVAAPHILAMLMQAAGLGGDMEAFSFHLWDGLFKYLIFLGYIAAISCMDDVRRVFQYHGAEHKAINAFEAGGPVTVETVRGRSRLHPRCGTTFLLFVLSIAILVHAAAVPLLLAVWSPEQPVIRHAVIVLFKMLLIVPVGSLAYELIRGAAAMREGACRTMLRAPGMFLQLLTTREPDDLQMEVAIASLREALGPDGPWSSRFPSPADNVTE